MRKWVSLQIKQRRNKTGKNIQHKKNLKTKAQLQSYCDVKHQQLT